MRPALARLLVLLAAALLSALPARAGAQALTYRFAGTADVAGVLTAVGFALTGDAAGVVDIGPSGDTPSGYANVGLSGYLQGATALRAAADYQAYVFTSAALPTAGAYFIPAQSTPGDLDFFLAGALFDAYDLRTALAPVSLTFSFSEGDLVYTGTGTFEVVAGVDLSPLPGGVTPPSSTVPEPGTWALLGTGLALVGAAGRFNGRKSDPKDQI
ncbi:PEP-CTERM sorting domain-containing protein [Roseisolibacter sp. H3M3-2]|uniref:PEP-CTERM sorting domain-containing protein n=1 Tax=Roseisolibacter sp. H3M3-2 TaxID=3031323 RepID=UPI0023DBC1B4|nr:PEP-CTERM sorting domain-containing protein [Roseisolibacter sp. H3M3-2]MDF1503998.1 PEP-CTERM sorting domain-containing protein [Roseisolibacter sp. H3M3-2]